MTNNAGSDRSVLAVLSDLGRDVPELLRREIELFKTELSEKLSQATHAGAGMVAGLMLGTAALLVVLQALVLGLAEFMPAWLASAVVGVLVGLVGLVMVLKGQRDMRIGRLVPERTVQSLKEDKRTIEENLR